MKNKFKVFLSLIFAVILPFSFVGCGDKSSDNSGSNAGQNSGTNPPSGEQEANYVLTEAEALRILGSSDEVNEAFVATLNNNAELLESENYTSYFGSRAAKVLNYSYYPKLISEAIKYKLNLKSQNLEFGKVYSFRQNNKFRYIQIDINGSSIQMEIVSYDLQNLVYYNFNFLIDNGNIEEIHISQLITPTRTYKIEFLDVTINIKNSSLKGCFANLAEHSIDNKVFFQDYFTKEKFNKISSYLTSSSFQYINLPDEVEIVSNSSDSVNAVVSEFDNFGFMNAFARFEQYTTLSENHINMQDDVFDIIDSNPASRITYSFNSTNFTFDKNI